MIEDANIAEMIYSEREIKSKRKIIRSKLIHLSENINNGTVSSLGTADLKILLNLYDEHFFNFYFKNIFKGKITFSLSKRMTRSAGKVLSPRDIKKLKPEDERYEIRLGVEFFFRYDDLLRDKTVNGLLSEDSLDAMLLVFEHELCHLLELNIYGKSSCKGKRFKKIAKNFFGHTDSYHKLPTPGEIAVEKFKIKPGDKVSFLYEMKKNEGIVQSINKRATVMVPEKNGIYENSAGKRFCKWYVPLNALEKI